MGRRNTTRTRCNRVRICGPVLAAKVLKWVALAFMAVGCLSLSYSLWELRDLGDLTNQGEVEDGFRAHERRVMQTVCILGAACFAVAVVGLWGSCRPGRSGVIGATLFCLVSMVSCIIVLVVSFSAHVPKQFTQGKDVQDSFDRLWDETTAQQRSRCTRNFVERPSEFAKLAGKSFCCRKSKLIKVTTGSAAAARSNCFSCTAEDTKADSYLACCALMVMANTADATYGQATAPELVLHGCYIVGGCVMLVGCCGAAHSNLLCGDGDVLCVDGSAFSDDSMTASLTARGRRQNLSEHGIYASSAVPVVQQGHSWQDGVGMTPYQSDTL